MSFILPFICGTCCVNLEIASKFDLDQCWQFCIITHNYNYTQMSFILPFTCHLILNTASKLTLISDRKDLYCNTCAQMSFNVPFIHGTCHLNLNIASKFDLDQ